MSSYIQETGRAGRDGILSMVTLLRARTYHHVDEDINFMQLIRLSVEDVFYLETWKAIHTVDINIKCMCCDICSISCVCGICKVRAQPFSVF